MHTNRTGHGIKGQDPQITKAFLFIVLEVIHQGIGCAPILIDDIFPRGAIIVAAEDQADVFVQPHAGRAD